MENKSGVDQAEKQGESNEREESSRRQNDHANKHRYENVQEQAHQNYMCSKMVNLKGHQP